VTAVAVNSQVHASIVVSSEKTASLGKLLNTIGNIVAGVAAKNFID
jgi:ribosome-associated protein YbcJ (S4-like RNA binding protein)